MKVTATRNKLCTGATTYTKQTATELKEQTESKNLILHRIIWEENKDALSLSLLQIK